MIPPDHGGAVVGMIQPDHGSAVVGMIQPDQGGAVVGMIQPDQGVLFVCHFIKIFATYVSYSAGVLFFF